MEERFNQIKTIRFEIKDSFAKLTAKKDTVRGYYIQYIEKNKKNKMFGLDSFHFQSKLIDLEYKHLNEHYIFIDNRIYCDYYKLYNILIAFYKQNFKTDFKHRNYPIYKDLEPFKQYDFDDINNIHYDIIEMIQHAYAIISQNNEEIKTDQQKLKSGFNIDNYVHNHIYKNMLLQTNINLYENYLNSYHIYHMDFLKNLLDKLGLFKNQLSTNVRTDGVTPVESGASSRSLDRVTSIDDDEEMKIIIDRSVPRISESKRYEVEEVKQQLAEEDAEEVKSEPVEEEIKESVEEVTEEPVEEEIKESIEEVTEEPVKEVIEEPVEELTEEPVKEVIESVEEVKPEVIEEAIQEVTEEPVEEVKSEVTEEVVEEVKPELTEEVKPEEYDFTKKDKEVVEEVKLIQECSRGIDPNDLPLELKKKKKNKRR